MAEARVSRRLIGMSTQEVIKIGQMADLHLGFRQYGLFERVEDFWNAARTASQKLIDAEVQLVVIPGDIYNDKRPYPIAQRHAMRILQMFKEKDIPVYVTRGNHDASYAWRERQGGDSLDILNDLGLVHYINDTVVEPKNLNVRIWGLGYYGKATGSKLVDLIEQNHELLEDKSKANILLLHAYLDSMIEGEDLSEYELGIHNFDYVAIGHYHKWWVSGSKRIVCSGSTEHTLSSDWDEPKRSAAVVELSKKGPSWHIVVNRLRYNVRPKIARILDLGLIDADHAMVTAKDTLREIDEDKALIRLELHGKLKDVSRSVDSREIANTATKALHVRVIDMFDFGGIAIKHDISVDQVMAEVFKKQFNIDNSETNLWVALALEAKDALLGRGVDHGSTVEKLLQDYSNRIPSLSTDKTQSGGKRTSKRGSRGKAN